MKLEFQERMEMEPTFGKNIKIGLISYSKSAGQEVPIKCKSLAEVEKAVTHLKSDLDEILQKAQAYFGH